MLRDWAHFWLQDFEGGGAEDVDSWKRRRPIETGKRIVLSNRNASSVVRIYCAGQGKVLFYGGFCWPTLETSL